jgi:amidase
MPVSLQLVARRLEEEKVLAMTETVLQAINSLTATDKDSLLTKLTFKARI